MNKQSGWLTVAAVAFLSVATVSPAAAQGNQGSRGPIEAALEPGKVAWITDSTGREEKGRIIGLSDGVVTASVADAVRRYQADDIRRIRTARSDSVLNGALIGAGVAVGTGLLLCRAMEPWDVCWSDGKSLAAFGAIGAGIGIGVDALIRGRRTVYETPGLTRLRATPIVGAGRRGVAFSVRF